MGLVCKFKAKIRCENPFENWSGVSEISVTVKNKSLLNLVEYITIILKGFQLRLWGYRLVFLLTINIDLVIKDIVNDYYQDKKSEGARCSKTNGLVDETTEEN